MDKHHVIASGAWQSNSTRNRFLLRKRTAFEGRVIASAAKQSTWRRTWHRNHILRQVDCFVILPRNDTFSQANCVRFGFVILPRNDAYYASELRSIWVRHSASQWNSLLIFVEFTNVEIQNLASLHVRTQTKQGFDSLNHRINTPRFYALQRSRMPKNRAKVMYHPIMNHSAAQSNRISATNAPITSSHCL